MFCGKCGFQIKDSEARCPRCGWVKPVKPKKDVFFAGDDRTMALDESILAFNKDDRTAAVGEIELPLTDDNRTVAVDGTERFPAQPLPQWEAPANFDYEEPRRQPVREEYYPPAAPSDYRQPQTFYRDDELIPEAYRTPHAQPPQKKKGHKGLIAVIIVASAVVLAAAGLLVYQMVYTSSEGYRAQKAATAILNGDYDEGLSYLSGFSSAQSDAVRSFTELMRARDAFAEAYNAGLLQTESDAVESACQTLRETYAAFTAAQLLPDALKEEYKTISERLSAMDAALAKLGVSDLYDAQQCLLAFQNRKRGESFTIADMENVVNTSSPAVKALETNLINNEAFQSLTASSGAQAVKTMNEFYNAVAAQSAQDTFDLENYRKTQNGDASLKLSDVDKNYEASVGTGLNALKGDADAEVNAKTLLAALKYAWTAYAFDVK